MLDLHLLYFTLSERDLLLLQSGDVSRWWGGRRRVRMCPLDASIHSHHFVIRPYVYFIFLVAATLPDIPPMSTTCGPRGYACGHSFSGDCHSFIKNLWSCFG